MLSFSFLTHAIKLVSTRDGRCSVSPYPLPFAPFRLPSWHGLLANGSVDEVLNSPRLLNLPLLLLANKQDSPSSLSVSEIREAFDAWQRAHPERQRQRSEEDGEEGVDRKGKGKAVDQDQDAAEGWDDGGAKDARMASLDVMGVSALEG